MFLERFCNTAADDQEQLLDPKQKKESILKLKKYLKIIILLTRAVSVIKKRQPTNSPHRKVLIILRLNGCFFSKLYLQLQNNYILL